MNTYIIESEDREIRFRAKDARSAIERARRNEWDIPEQIIDIYCDDEIVATSVDVEL